MKNAITIWAILVTVILNAQPNSILKFRFEPKNTELTKNYNEPERLDSIFINKRIQELVLQCQVKSYLTAKTSSIVWKADTCLVTIDLGKSYLIKEIRQGNVPIEWLSASGWRGGKLQGNKFNSKLLGSEIYKIITYAENNGFPFASIFLDSIEVDTQGVEASLFLQKNELTYFDSIDFGGDAKMSKVFLKNYSGIKPTTIYDESLLKNLDSRLSELPYVQVIRPLGVYFYGNKAKPYVYINNRKASSFDGVIGFAPNSEVNNKLVITGDLNLKLQNIVGSGKNLELAYRGYLNNSQDLQFKFMWPYFLQSKLGVDYSFKLLKFDSSWLELVNDIGLQYRFMGNNYLKVFYQYQNISLLTADTNFIKNQKKLPNTHDVKNDLFGLAFRKSTLNYFSNPSKGYVLEMEGGAGTKRIIKNSTFENIQISDGSGNSFGIYDSLKLSSLQYKFKIDAAVFTKLYKQFVLLTQVKAAIIANDNLFVNELFRIGGLKTLRGFDEQSIFASQYFIGNIELRYLLQTNSNFLVFWNGAWYQNQAQNPIISDRPWGVGIGLNLETGAGIFSLYYAMGKQKNNPFEFNQAKIHFGLINYF
ncbi:MAG: hypothetical protein K9H61_00245 [Bacteroidia bacterium]|nr:hypothetical protein [Bacteroidia bacterium]MCF8426011.1 hypothetical protein [Bacteroidia bacterium]MCF8445394.1 hypothetical protein [Bacteroidia bacterium]